MLLRATENLRKNNDEDKNAECFAALWLVLQESRWW